MFNTIQHLIVLIWTEYIILSFRSCVRCANRLGESTQNVVCVMLSRIVGLGYTHCLGVFIPQKIK